MNLPKRFTDKIHISTTNFFKGTPCWEWTGIKHSRGYGYISIKGGMMLTHRFIYNYHYGNLDTKLDIDHLCNNPSCSNHLHLQQVPHRVNVLRGNGLAAINKRKTHCIRGHEFTPENIIKGRNDARHCRECHKASVRKYEQSHKAQTNITKQKYRDKNRDRVNEIAQKGREKNRERINQQSRERWSKNREMMLKKQQDYRNAHRKEMKRKAREYYANNSEKQTKSSLEYARKNRDKINAKRRENEARKKLQQP